MESQSKHKHTVHGIFQARVLEWGAIAFSLNTHTHTHTHTNTHMGKKFSLKTVTTPKHTLVNDQVKLFKSVSKILSGNN